MEVSSAKRVHRSEWTESGVPFLRSSDVVAAFNHKENEKVFISQEHYDVLVAQSGKLRIGDLLVTGGGSIGVPMLVKTDKPLYFKDADLIWFKNKGALNGSFLFYSFVGDLVQDYIKQTAHIGTISHYTIERGKKTPINITTLKDEQAKIGTFFEKLDNLIAANQRKLDKLKLLKKGYLQQIFGQKMRFKGYFEPWERRKFVNIIQRVSKISDMSYLPRVEFNDIISNEGRLNKDITKRVDTRKGVLFQAGDILYGKLRPYLNNWLFPNFSGIALGDFWVFRSRNNNENSFIYSLIQSPKYQMVANISTGTKMPRSDWKIVSEIEFGIPKDKQEQLNIGTFFNIIDNLIAANGTRLNHLKKLKKAYLQQMFI